MHNRNKVKWNPFNSLINGDQVAKELSKQTQKQAKPILSEDQLTEISKKLIDALTTKSLINIKYYENGVFFTLEGIAKFYNKNTNSIIINNKNIYLTQIIDINLVNF